MPSGPRIRANNVYGIISNNPLTAVATTYNSISLPLLPVVVSAHAVVVLDPKRVYGDPEIVVVTTHTAASTVASILRGQYGTSARLHPVGTAWAHVPIDEDYTAIVTSGTRPSNPYEGQYIYEIDTTRYLGWAGSAWVRQDSLGTVGRTGCVIARRANQSFNSAAENFISWDTEVSDSDGFFAPTSDTVTVPAGLGGLYYIASYWNWSAVAATRGFTQLFIAGTAQGRVINTGDDQTRATWILPVAAGQTIKITAFQQSGGALNFSQTSQLQTEIFRIGT